MLKSYTLTEKLWLYPGKAGWFFITIPHVVTKEIDFYFSLQKKGWGSLPVKVTIGATEWKTSIFPDKKTGTYLLPVKKAVRVTEGLEENKVVDFELVLSS